MRPCKKRLPGSDVSIPANPPLHAVESEIKEWISSGRFTLGEECAPYKITKFVPINGTLTPQEIVVHARKVPLKQLRQKLLEKQHKYMRLTPMSSIAAMPIEDLRHRLPNISCDDLTKEDMCRLLFQHERTRHLCMWHDHACILNKGFVMITMHVMYDNTLFYTDEEFEEMHPGETISVQSEVEQPEIHLLSLGSSTVADQAALIGDRLDCIRDLTTEIEASDGTSIADRLRFFTGNHPATQFEGGTKQGGHFKCGACGVKECMFNNQAHSLHREWRSLSQLQSLATAECQRELNSALRGVARAPALLLTNPHTTLVQH